MPSSQQVLSIFKHPKIQHPPLGKIYHMYLIQQKKKMKTLTSHPQLFLKR